MIDLSKLEYHTASRDAQGKPVLLPKRKPEGWDKADAISRRTYQHSAAREADAVTAAARDAALPGKPANWDRGLPIDHLTWYYEVSASDIASPSLCKFSVPLVLPSASCRRGLQFRLRPYREECAIP
jgi:hypothetical protein